MVKNGRNRRFQPEEDKRILAMSASGKTLRFMAMALDRNSSSIKYRLELLKRGFDLRRVTPIAEKKTKQDLSGVVRCLGGCEKNWLSPDRFRIRICPSCKKAHHNSSVHTVEYGYLGGNHGRTNFA
jgi:hypothetical protein